MLEGVEITIDPLTSVIIIKSGVELDPTNFLIDLKYPFDINIPQ